MPWSFPPNGARKVHYLFLFWFPCIISRGLLEGDSVANNSGWPCAWTKSKRSGRFTDHCSTTSSTRTGMGRSEGTWAGHRNICYTLLVSFAPRLWYIITQAWCHPTWTEVKDKSFKYGTQSLESSRAKLQDLLTSAHPHSALAASEQS